MNYEVLRTATVEEQIREIVFYLTDLAGNPEPALRFLDELEHAASTLSAFPRSGMVPRWGTLARRGYRAVTVGKYLVFSSINDEKRQVIIDAVVYGAREYWKLV